MPDLGGGKSSSRGRMEGEGVGCVRSCGGSHALPADKSRGIGDCHCFALPL